MVHQLCLGYGRAEIGAVGHGGHLISEPGSAHNGSRRDRRVHAQPQAYAGHGDSDGSDGSPGGSHDHAHHTAENEGCDQKQPRRNHLKACNQHGWHSARRHKRAHHHAHGHDDGGRADTVFRHLVGQILQLEEIVTQDRRKGRDHQPAQKQHQGNVQVQHAHSRCHKGHHHRQSQYGD